MFALCMVATSIRANGVWDSATDTSGVAGVVAAAAAAATGVPAGGVKQSGIGREGGGQIGLKEFVDVTSLRIAKKGLKK